MNRIVITGWPRSGKSYAAAELGRSLHVTPQSTDDLIPYFDWSALSEQVSYWFDLEGPWIIEGVAVLRALRKWHARHPDLRPPFDQLYILPKPNEGSLLPGQISMGKGIDKVFEELELWLGCRQPKKEDK